MLELRAATDQHHNWVSSLRSRLQTGGCDSRDGELTLTGFAPTIIIFGLEQVSGDIVHTVQAPEARSEARRSSAGTVSVLVEGPPGVGRPGEHRVAKTLRARLQSDGVPSSIRSGIDARGEDRVIDTAGVYHVLQIVTVPRDTTLWKQASAGSGTTTVTTPAAAGWIEDAIRYKVSLPGIRVFGSQTLKLEEPDCMGLR